MDKRQIITWVLIIAITACWDAPKRQPERDDFYETKGGWDWIRVPLIKPYEALKIDPEVQTNPWVINLFSPNLVNTDHVRKICVKDSILYIISGMVAGTGDSTSLGTRNLPTVWFIINSKQKTEKGFKSAKEFDKYIVENNYPLPDWHDIDTLFHNLSNGGKLPWRKE